MTRAGTTSANRFVVGCYVGFVLAVGGVVVPSTLTAGFLLHIIVSGQTETFSVAKSVDPLVKAGISICLVCLVLYIVCRIVSAISDGLFIGALPVPDGRKMTGLLGLTATFLLAAVWALSLWNSLLPELAAMATEAAPAGLPGNQRTFIAVVPVISALYGYLVLTGHDYTLPEMTSSSTRPDTPGYDRVTTPTMPRTTKTTTAPTRAGGNHGKSDSLSAANDTGTGCSDSASTISVENPTPEGSGGDAPTSDDTDCVGDVRAEFEKDIQEQEQNGPDERGKTPDNSSSVDLHEYRFNWGWKTNVSLDDIGGMDDVKEDLGRDIIKPMREDPEKAETFDIPLPNVLLYGPPGTGKTYMAKALATELGFPFVDLSGSDVTSKWVNESSGKVGQLFDEAEDLAGEVGGAVIFLDELDAVIPERQMDSHGEDRKVVNEFLSRLQEAARQRVLFVGATNRRGDLDSAATRNGRIDKEIAVEKPDYEARVDIFKAQLDGRPNDLNEGDIEALAEKTADLVAADIESLVNQAARDAAYGRDAERIEVRDIERQLN